MSITLLSLLATSKYTIDRVASNASQRIVSWGQEQSVDVNLVAHRGYSNMYPDNSLYFKINMLLFICKRVTSFAYILKKIRVVTLIFFYLLIN